MTDKYNLFVNVPPKMMDFVIKEVREGGFEDTEEYLRSLIAEKMLAKRK